ncbi:MAG: Ig-like domain-containing protein [Bacteroidota bacterium]
MKTGISRIAAFALLLLLMAPPSVNAQTGYIYVHKKSLNEVDQGFNFSVSGGSTSVVPFTLNDNPTQFRVKDIGAAENGRLWAATESGALYYRNVNSTIWTLVSAAGVARVDGGPGGSCYYINVDGTVFSHSGTGSAVQISGTAQFPPASGTTTGYNDIASGWTGTSTAASPAGPALYVVRDNNIVYKYDGTGSLTTDWNTYTTITTTGYTGFQGYRADVNPTNGNLYVAGNTTGGTGTLRNIKLITPTGIATSPTPNIGNGISTGGFGYPYRDIAVNQIGEIYAITNDQITEPLGVYVHKYAGGTSWVKETGSFDGYRITGGVANSVWVTMASGGAVITATSPFYNIFSRSFNGTEPVYIDDERVRTTVGNSQLIPVNPGTYTITEADVAGWDLQKIAIYDPTPTGNSSSQSAGTSTVTVAAGEVVHVVYQNGQLNPQLMDRNCNPGFIETFGSGTAGSFGLPVAGQTSYHYMTGVTPGGEDGHYKIVSRGPDFNSWGGASTVVDHTPDGNAVGSGSNQGGGTYGYMYAVNAGYDKSEFFRRQFTNVVPGSFYEFSAWILDFTPGADVKPNVLFTIYDHNTQAVLGTYSTGDFTGTAVNVWNKYGFNFQAPAGATDIDLVIANNGFGGNGNDLALDDIGFRLYMPDPVINIVNASCSGTTGTITVSSPISAAVPPIFEYVMDNTAGTWQTTTVFNNVPLGIHTIYARYVGSTNCIVMKTDTVKAAICGNVYHDVNGLTDNSVNASGTYVVPAQPLFAVLYDITTGKVVDTDPVSGTGTYTLYAFTGNNYAVYLTTTSATIGQTATPTITLPTGWVSTGEYLGTGIGNDLSVNSILPLGTVSGSLQNANFGIEQRPTAVNDTYSVPQNGTITLLPLTNDTDPDGTIKIVSINGVALTPGTAQTIAVTNGTVTISAGGVINFTPALNYTGPVTFPYVISDGTATATANVNITVTPNNQPVAVNDTYTMPEDGAPVTLLPLTSDTDPDGNTLTVTSINGITLTPGIAQTITVPNGTVNINAAGVITFTPNANYNGTVTFPYVISDGNGGTATANEVITVTPVNDPPVAVTDNYTMPEDGTPVTLTPLALDSDIDGGTLTISSINGVTRTPGTAQTIPVPNGTVNITAAGVITFTPSANYYGTVTFPYIISDGNGGTATANEVITVTPVNDPPVAVTDNYTMPEDGTPVTLTPLALDSDIDGGTLTISSINGVTRTPGTAQTIPVPNGTVNITAAGVITFTPSANYYGTVTFPYIISDGNGGTATANEVITVTPVNDPPVAVTDTYTMPEDGTPVTLTPLTLDSDPDGNPLSIVSINGTTLTPGTAQTIPVTNGTVNINTAGIITFTPNANYNGTVTFPYVISDGTATATANEIINVTSTTDITGYVFNDTNGLTDGTVNGTGTNAGGLYANLVGADDKVISSVLVDPATGKYAFSAADGVAANTTYTIILTATMQTDGATLTTAILPTGWVSTGEHLGAAAGHDGLPANSKLSVSVVTTDIDAANFGIEQPPVAGSGSNSAINPGGTTSVTVPANTFSNIVISSDMNPGTVSSIRLVAFPTNTTSITINGIVYNAGVPAEVAALLSLIIPVDGSGNPSLAVSLDPDFSFAGSSVISFKAIDNAGRESFNTGIATMNFTNSAVTLRLKVLLQGAVRGNESGLETTMRDNLRSSTYSAVTGMRYIPDSDPYTNDLSFSGLFTKVGDGTNPAYQTVINPAEMFADRSATATSAVDWIFVELRSKADSTVVLGTRSVLVQQDGTVADIDGSSCISFPSLLADNYFVAVRHRNHLGVMSATALPVSSFNCSTVVDFTTMTDAGVWHNPATPQYDGLEMALVTNTATNTTLKALWAGNANTDNKVKYQGGANDRTLIQSDVVNYPTNTTLNVNYDLGYGYHRGDINMDSKVKYQGGGNDRTLLQSLVLGYLLNTTINVNYDLFLEQLPIIL